MFILRCQYSTLMSSLHSVIDVSNFFVDYFKRSVDPMTLPRVQAFVYFTQAECLCRLGRPMFAEEIRAYPTGPAVSKLGFYYEDAGNGPIEVHREFNPRVFTPEEYDLLMDVALYLNTFSTSQLQIMAFATGSPWQVFYTSREITTIPNESIREYYQQLPRVPSYKDQIMDAVSASLMTPMEYGAEYETSEPTIVYTENEVAEAWESSSSQDRS